MSQPQGVPDAPAPTTAGPRGAVDEAGHRTAALGPIEKRPEDLELTEQHATEARWRGDDLAEAFLEDERILERLAQETRERARQPEQER
jgi:hypothetical protein